MVQILTSNKNVMRMRGMTHLLVGLLWAAVLLVSPVLVSADQATYIYDDLGRLSQVIDEGRKRCQEPLFANFLLGIETGAIRLF